MFGCGGQTELTGIRGLGIQIDWIRRSQIPDNGVSRMGIFMR